MDFCPHIPVHIRFCSRVSQPFVQGANLPFSAPAAVERLIVGRQAKSWPHSPTSPCWWQPGLSTNQGANPAHCAHNKQGRSLQLAWLKTNAARVLHNDKGISPIGGYNNLSIYAPNTGAPKYIKEINGHICKLNSIQCQYLSSLWK